MRRTAAPIVASLALACACTLAASAQTAQTSATPEPDAPPAMSAESVFSSAKAAWRARVEPPFVTYSLRERYTWRSRVHDNWWHGAFRASDAALSMRRLIVPGDERERLRGTPISLNIRMRGHMTRAENLDTNASADAFPVLDPLVPPDAAFGLRREAALALVSSASTAAGPSPAPSASAAPSAPPEPATPGPEALRELARVEAVARDYALASAGVDRLRYGDAYHITLSPLRDPGRNRLRDLWVDARTFATVQLAVQGLFGGKPYAEARWIVSYVPLEGRWFVQQIRADEPLRFGLDRTVGDLTYDFVDYGFPADVAPIEFRRLL